MLSRKWYRTCHASLIGCVVTLVSFALIPSTVDAQVPDSTVTIYEGCFVLTWGPWMANDTLVGPGWDEYLEERITLTAARLGDLRSNVRVVRPSPGERASIFEFVYWEDVTQNQIRVTWDQALSGIRLDLTVSGVDERGLERIVESMKGIAYQFHDDRTVTDRIEANVHATREGCYWRVR